MGFESPLRHQNAVVCSNPASARPLQILVAYLDSDTVAFFRQGDHAWILNSLPVVIHDVVYFDKEFYFLHRRGQLAEIQLNTSRLISSRASPCKFTWLTHPTQHPEWEIRRICCRVVEATGDLLLFTRYSIKEFVKKLGISVLDRSQKGWKWVEIGILDMESFRWLHCVSAQVLPSCNGYPVYVAFESDVHASTCSIQIIDVIPGLGITKLSCLHVPKESRWGNQWDYQESATWIVPRLH